MIDWTRVIILLFFLVDGKSMSREDGVAMFGIGSMMSFRIRCSRDVDGFNRVDVNRELSWVTRTKYWPPSHFASNYPKSGSELL
jgi:hypothetical protein